MVSLKTKKVKRKPTLTGDVMDVSHGLLGGSHVTYLYVQIPAAASLVKGFAAV